MAGSKFGYRKPPQGHTRQREVRVPRSSAAWHRKMRLLGPFAEQGNDVLAFIIRDGDIQGSSIDNEAKLVAFIADFILKELVHVRLLAP